MLDVVSTLACLTISGAAVEIPSMTAILTASSPFEFLASICITVVPPAGVAELLETYAQSEEYDRGDDQQERATWKLTNVISKVSMESAKGS